MISVKRAFACPAIQKVPIQTFTLFVAEELSSSAYLKRCPTTSSAGVIRTWITMLLDNHCVTTT
jgi:hypothetical protein